MSASQSSWKLPMLREAGLGVREFKLLRLDAGACRRAGFSAKELMAEFHEAEVAHAGYGMRELRESGVGAGHIVYAFPPSELRDAGYPLSSYVHCAAPRVLRELGHTARELSEAGMRLTALRTAFSDDELRAAGVRVLGAHTKPTGGSRARCSRRCNPEISHWKADGSWSYDEEYDGGSIGEYGYAHACAVCGRCPNCQPDGCDPGAGAK